MADRVPNDLFRGDPGDIERGLDEWVAGFERDAARYQELNERVDQLRLTATSPNGIVTVTVDATGGLVDATFTDRVVRTSPDELRHQLLAALALAKGKIVGQVREATAETLGERAGESAARIVDYYRERFPEPPEPGKAARRPRTGDDEFDAGSVFE